MERIRVSGPWITQKEVDYVADAARNAWYANANMYHDRFEKAFAEFTGARYAMALPSCTSAIHLALAALGVGQGDEVIVPDITWIATAAPIDYVGATPIFADVDENSWCLSAESFERCISPRTKAVIPVDLYGGLPDMDAIQAIADKHDIAVIEDAAEALGSRYRGRRAGSFGAAGVFSFHGSKTLTTGEGGMLVTDRKDLYDQAAFLRDHGRKPGDRMFWNSEVAYKYKMSSMQAALGLAQLERVEELLARKRQIFDWYARQLGHAGLRLNAEPDGVWNTYWMVTVLVSPQYGMDKEKLMAEMSKRNIDCRPFFYPLSSLPAYEALPQTHVAQRENKVSYRLSPYGMNLPCGLNITESDVAYVCKALREVLGIA